MGDRTPRLQVMTAREIGRELVQALEMLDWLFGAGGVLIIERGTAAGEHTDRTLELDLALIAAQEDRRVAGEKWKPGYHRCAMSKTCFRLRDEHAAKMQAALEDPA